MNYYTTYYDDGGVPIDADDAWRESAAEYHEDEIEELENKISDLQDEIDELEEKKDDLDEDSDELHDIETKIDELEEKIGDLDAEIEELQNDDSESVAPSLHQIVRVDVERLLKNFYDDSTNTLKLDEMLRELTEKVSLWVTRHKYAIEALLDTSFFEEHNGFFEDLYSKKLIDDNDLLKVFQTASIYSFDKFGEYLFVRDHKDLMLKILNEFAYCQLAGKEINLKYSLEELCDRLIHYATHSIYNVCDDWSLNSGSNGLEEELLDEDDIDHEFVKRVERFKVIGLLEFLDFEEVQKLEIFELLKNNEIARDRLNYIIDNNLDTEFDFDSLMKYLKKEEKKYSIAV